RIETSISLNGTPQTCSLGIGSWPVDGVIREDIVQSVDAALYYAKQTGRNRICLASEVSPSDVLKSPLRKQTNMATLCTVYALAATVDAKDHYTYGHSKKMSKYAAYIAEAIGYSQEAIERIRAAALLHDIGKIGISDNLLNKTGYLTPDDFEPIKTHPDKGVAILKHVESLKDCIPGVRYHHEHYDGTGYPAGLKGDSIPLDARILAVADAYDAMTSKRPYRELQASPEDAISELKHCSGTQFDPEIVQAFIHILSDELRVIEPLEEILQYS
ncbi:HD domain-containing phosphohydrolase, partial [Chloroflexota bacterium]